MNTSTESSVEMDTEGEERMINRESDSSQSSQRLMQTRNGGKRVAEENDTTLSNKQRGKAAANLLFPARIMSTTPKKVETTSSKNKKAKLEAKADEAGQINEDLAREPISGQKSAKLKGNKNFHPDWIPGLNILDIPWPQLQHTIGLGHGRSVVPRSEIPLILKTWIKIYQESAADPYNERKIKKVLLLPLATGLKAGTDSNRGDIRKICKDLQGDWALQVIENFPGRYKPSSKNKRKGPKSLGKTEAQIIAELTSKRVIELAYDGEWGKAFKALTVEKNKSIEPSLSVVDSLKDLHFKKILSTTSQPMDIQNLTLSFIITPEETREVINKMHSRVHSGQDSLSIDLLKQLVRYNSGIQGQVNDADVLIIEITNFLNRTIANPSVPLFISRFIAGAEEIAIGKKDGSIRNIAMVMVFRKIAGKVGLQQNKSDIKDLFDGNQLGCGATNGTDKMFHLANLANVINPTHDLVKNDCTAAFPNISSTAVLKAVEKDIPSMFNMMKALIGVDSNSVYAGCKEGIQDLPIFEGVPQGAPESPVCLGVVKRPVTLAAGKMLSNGWTMDYMDDNNAGGITTELIDMCNYVVEAGAPLGLFLSAKKCEVLLGVKASLEEARYDQQRWVENNNISPEQVRINPANSQGSDAEFYGMITMGAPVGSTAFIQNFMLNLVQELKLKFEKIPTVDNPQVEYALLRICMSSIINHILRLVRPSETVLLVSEVSILQRKCVAAILRLNAITDQTFTVVRLDAGGNLGFIEDIAEPAWVASMIGSLLLARSKLPLLDAIVADIVLSFDDLDSLSLATMMEHEQYPKIIQEFFITAKKLQDADPNISITTLLAMPEAQLNRLKLQNLLGSHMRAKRAEDYKAALFEKGDATGVAVWDSISNKQSFAWVNAEPTSPAMRMTSAQWLTAFRTRVSADLPGIEMGLTCNCGGNPKVDPKGYHFAKCKNMNGLTIASHNGVNQDFASYLKAAGIACSTTFPPPFLDIYSEESGTNNTTGDIMIYGGARGNTLLDTRITNPVTALVERGHYAEAGQAARESELEKNRKYKQPCEAVNIRFIPICFESFGRWGGAVTQLFNDTNSVAADNKKINVSSIINYWERRISMSIVKGVANAMNARIYNLLSGREAQLDESSNPAVLAGQSYTRGSSGMPAS